MSKFSNIRETDQLGDTFKIKNKTLTTDVLNEIFNDIDVIKNTRYLVMENCRFVGAADDELRTIPDSISNLTKLNTLNLYDSDLEILPGKKNQKNEKNGKIEDTGLYALTHLEELNLTGNPIILNTHNVYLLHDLFLNKKSPSERKNARIGMRITFFKENKNDKRPVIGNLDLVSKRFNKSNKPVNQHILLESDFEELKKMVPEPAPAPAPEPEPEPAPAPEPAPKLSSSSLSSLSSSPTAPSPSSKSSAPKSKSSSSKASKASKSSSSSKRSTKKKKSTPK